MQKASAAAMLSGMLILCVENISHSFFLPEESHMRLHPYTNFLLRLDKPTSSSSFMLCIIASGLAIQASVCLSFRLWDPTREADPWWPCGCCHSLCELICALVVQFLQGLVSSIPSRFYTLSAFLYILIKLSSWVAAVGMSP